VQLDTVFILIFNRRHYIVNRKIFYLFCIVDITVAHSLTCFAFLIVCIVIVYFNVLNFDDIHHSLFQVAALMRRKTKVQSAKNF
jgi:hypothetical protein